MCPCSGSVVLGQGSEVLWRTCAGLHAGGVCKTCSDGPGIARCKIFCICHPRVHGRQCYCQHSRNHLGLGPGYGQKYSLSGYPDSELLPPRAGCKSIFLAALWGGTDEYAGYLGHRRMWQQLSSMQALLRHLRADSATIDHFWGNRVQPSRNGGSNDGLKK